MPSKQNQFQRILMDAAGYLLLLAALLTGWLPGPGGIPLAMAGLGLLAVHNTWARRIRTYFTSHGSALSKLIFLDKPWLQATYDIIVSALLISAAIIAWQHGAVWQLGIGIAFVGLAMFIGFMNRNRYEHLKARFNRKRNRI